MRHWPRRFSTCFRDISRVFDPMPGQQVFGLTIHTTSNHTLFVADTSVHERPTPEVMVEIAKQSAAKARQMGHEPRIAFLSYSNFGNPPVDYTERSRPSREPEAAVITADGLQVVRGTLLPVQPTDRTGQCADHAGAPFGPYRLAVTPVTGRRHGCRPSADGAGKTHRDRPNALDGQ